MPETGAFAHAPVGDPSADPAEAPFYLPTGDEVELFRTAYEAGTLRGNLGLPVPANRHTRERRLVADDLQLADDLETWISQSG